MSIDRPARILAEAERLFAVHGFAGTNLSSIASAAGLGNAGLLHHFPSKAVLYRAVLEGIAADLDERNAAAAAVADETVGRLRGLIDAFLSLHRDRPTALLVVAQEFLDRSERIDEARVFPLAGVVRDTVAALDAGQRDGTIPPGDPVAMTAALHGALLFGVLGRGVYTATAGHRPQDWDVEIARRALAGVLVDSEG